MAQVEVDPTQDTEFHDALRRHGIIPPKPPSRSPSPDLPSSSELREDALHRVSQSQIDALLDGETVRRGDGARRNGNDDDDDDEDDLKLDEDDDQERKLMLRLREQRMAEMRIKERRARFGRVFPISRVDYTREVTEASKGDPDRPQGSDTADRSDGTGSKSESKGTAVVCFLYKDGLELCKLLGGYLDTIASKNPATKFVSIVGDKCIPNYPDRNLPTLLIYRNGDLHRQIVGLRPEIGLDGMNTKLADVELLLTAVGAIERPDQRVASKNAGQDAAEDDEEDEPRSRSSGIRNGGSGAGTGSRTSTVRTQEEEDADLDWDL
ncbi:unnamed protein product [Tilletia controversa]|uniref:Phosducin domain-containing protein n=2 Tax=Tilletia TaxID=13289 RepID=A0A177U103_9BASI|nr:hypothetical protein CF336_g7281 [Tilletia laevis]KAE8189082.1 hypothetical protein CF328_g6393 [Tilletia controversa]KAE8248503.1 hypothetical protein A4X03_0g6761 [Tilletia caries]KAE8188525.1 hypothetical protein CF335_g6874 [Tilletia laevis]CAD6885496.1 unnamed protein product [Tilletia caries]